MVHFVFLLGPPPVRDFLHSVRFIQTIIRRKYPVILVIIRSSEKLLVIIAEEDVALDSSQTLFHAICTFTI